MSLNITKAMILAAGLGTRLRPLTEKTPKPMIPLGGRPLIDYNLQLLLHVGIKEVMINLHYLGEQIQAHVESNWASKLTCHFSSEPTILGTGGGVKKVESFFEGQSFILMNADILIDIALNDVIAHHNSSRAIATMVVRKLLPNEPYNTLRVHDDGMLTAFERGDHMFCGMHVITPKFLEFLPEQGASCIIQDGYMPALKKGAVISTFCHDGYWNDLGTMERYNESQTHLELLQNKF